MGDNSKISWTDATWNPVVGCTKVSEGCAHCYAERDHNKRHKAYCEGKLQNVPQYAKPFNQVQLIDSRLDQPCRWKRPRKIFVNSLSDLFHESVSWAFIDRVFRAMTNSVHTFQILTKRPDIMDAYFHSRIMHPLSNVWLGVTVENQQRADERIPLLAKIPAAVRFVSVEPMLSPIKLFGFGSPTWGMLPPNAFIQLVICGGESGPYARPMHPNWARSLRDQCIAAGVDFFFKQWGEWTPNFPTDVYLPNLQEIILEGTRLYKLSTKKAGNLLDGQTWQQMPEVA